MVDYFEQLGNFPIYKFDSMLFYKKLAGSSFNDYILGRIPKLYLIFNHSDLILIDPIDPAKDSIDFNYKMIFQAIKEKEPTKFHGWNVSEKSYDEAWLKNNLKLYISHCHSDHWMGIINKTFPLKNQTATIKLIIPQNAEKYIKDFGKHQEIEDEILKHLYNEDFLRLIRLVCANRVGNYKVLIKELESYIPIRVSSSSQYNCCEWKESYIHGGNGLRLEIKKNLKQNNDLETQTKQAWYLYDLYPPRTPLSSSFYPHTNVLELIELYDLIISEINEGHISVIFWSHGHPEDVSLEDDFDPLIQEIKKFKIFHDTIKRELGGLPDPLLVSQILQFCEAMTRKHISTFFNSVKAPDDKTLQFFFNNCSSSLNSIDDIKILQDDLRRESDGEIFSIRKFFEIVSFVTILLNLIFAYKKATCEKYSQ